MGSSESDIGYDAPGGDDLVLRNRGGLRLDVKEWREAQGWNTLLNPSAFN